MTASKAGLAALVAALAVAWVVVIATTCSISTAIHSIGFVVVAAAIASGNSWASLVLAVMPLTQMAYIVELHTSTEDEVRARAMAVAQNWHAMVAFKLLAGLLLGSVSMRRKVCFVGASCFMSIWILTSLGSAELMALPISMAFSMGFIAGTWAHNEATPRAVPLLPRGAPA